MFWIFNEYKMYTVFHSERACFFINKLRIGAEASRAVEI
jgi:hypothetical protein